MKLWMRRGARVFSLILALCFLFLTGCASSAAPKEPLDPDLKEALERFAGEYMEWLGGLSEDELQDRIGGAERRKDAVVYNGLTNYINSLGRLGAFQSVENVLADSAKDGYEMEITSRYAERALQLRLVLSEDKLNEDLTYLSQAYQSTYGMSYAEGFRDWTFDEMTFEPDYTMGEKLADAGGNLAIGMGTVFLVLIFIAWIISLFKYIHVWEESKKNKLMEEAEPLPTRAEPGEGLLLDSPESTVSAEAIGGAELQAVIAAAVAAYEADRAAEAGTGDTAFVPGPPLANGLVVRSIRRK